MKYLRDADNAVWQLTEREFTRLKRDLLACREADLGFYGKQIADWVENYEALEEWAEHERNSEVVS